MAGNAGQYKYLKYILLIKETSEHFFLVFWGVTEGRAK